MTALRPACRGLERLPAPRDFVLRGTLLDPVSANHCDLTADGGLALVDGYIALAGPLDEVRRAFPALPVDEPSGSARRLVLPAFCDTHVHWVQWRRRGVGKPLLDWLREEIWPEEARFADPAYAEEAATEFFGELAARGTLAASIYGSVHEHSVTSALAHALGYAAVGNVLMTVNAPPALLSSENESLAVAATLAERWRSSYVATPRFAPTCSTRVMREAGALAHAHDAWIQTHLAESPRELEWVQSLFPEARDYTDVYDRAGILGPRTIMGHCIHLGDGEYDRLAATGTRVAHCPISNVALGSGRMPLAPLRERGIPWALGTDVGASPWLSMLCVMKSFVEVHRGIEPATAVEALYRATHAGWTMLGLGSVGGRLAVGMQANLAIVETESAAGVRDADDAESVLRSLLETTDTSLDRAVTRVLLGGRPIDGQAPELT